MTEVQILSSSSNCIVAKLNEREYPGVLIQGDTLRILLGDLEELEEELLLKNIDSAMDVTKYVKERIKEILSHYETVLEEHGINLPYVSPVIINKRKL